jgi:ABC-type branched-subunit amino acid transport system substrate-binding protein
MKRHLKLALCISAFALPAAGLAQDAYLVGVSGAMTGPVAAGYAPIVEFMKAYLDHVNARGGINGKPVRVIVLDDQAQPSRAATNAKKLLEQDKVHVLVNNSLSSTYAPMVAESKRAGVPLVYAGGVCPPETYPPADPLQFCSTAYSANLDTEAMLEFIKGAAKGPVRIGFAGMAIPLVRSGIDGAEKSAARRGFTPVGTQYTPPPAPDYTPFATKLKEGNPNWVLSWSPWLSEVRTVEALRRIGWDGDYIAWAHFQAEEELERLKDGRFYVIGTNAFLEAELPIHAEMRAIAHRAGLKYPTSYLTEGYVAGLVIEAALAKTAWPPTAAKATAALSNLKVDLKGLRGGPLEWTKDNHFRTAQYYRIWRWDPAQNKVVRVQDWKRIETKR